LQILRLGSNGEGVARADGFTVFVPGALSDEQVLAKVVVVKKTYAVAELLEIITKSPDRVEPDCPLYDRCGGCQLQHYVYTSQLLVKQQQVQDALERIGHLYCEVLPTLGMQSPWRYRNKMQFPVKNQGGIIEIGCYALKTHGVINTSDCLIQEEGNNLVLAAVREWMERFHVSAYDEKTGRGLVRHVMSRSGAATQIKNEELRMKNCGKDGPETLRNLNSVSGTDHDNYSLFTNHYSLSDSGEVLAVLVCTKAEVPHSEELIGVLRERVPGLVGIVVNVNPRQTNIIMGKECRTLWGREYLLDGLEKLQFRVSPLSFFQVNRQQAEVLYNKVLNLSGLTGNENVVDVYCGTGTISLFLAQRAGKVIGIEIVTDAIADAKENARYNHISNAKFIAGDAAKELPKLLADGFKPDVVVVDPPRAGCEEKVLHSILSVEPKRIVYVSCNPATLARDLQILSGRYTINVVQPVDMFPQTMHVETVVSLSIKNQ